MVLLAYKVLKAMDRVGLLQSYGYFLSRSLICTTSKPQQASNQDEGAFVLQCRDPRWKGCKQSEALYEISIETIFKTTVGNEVNIDLKVSSNP